MFDLHSLKLTQPGKLDHPKRKFNPTMSFRWQLLVTGRYMEVETIFSIFQDLPTVISHLSRSRKTHL